MGNFNPIKPTKYTGTNKYISFFVSRNRQPLLSDYRQPETGTLYSVGTLWQVSKDPTTGTEGEIWVLQKIVSNQAFWALLSATGGSGGPATGVVSPTTPSGGAGVGGDFNTVGGAGNQYPIQNAYTSTNDCGYLRIALHNYRNLRIMVNRSGRESVYQSRCDNFASRCGGQRNDPSVTSIPKSKAEFVALVKSRKDYKDRKKRDAEKI
jgi:hypothetical protein